MTTTTTRQSSFIGGVLICLLGAVCFSTKAILVKLAYRETSVDAVTLLALRMLFSLPFFIISAIASSRKADNVKFTISQWAYVALIGCLGYYISSLLDFLGLQYISAGIERLVLFIYPTLVLLMSALIFKEKIKTKQWVAVLITYIGLSIAFLGEITFQGTHDRDFYIGSLLIFACAITYAMYIVGSGRIIPQVGAAKFNSYAMSFACAGVLIHFFITSKESLIGLETDAYLYGFVMAVLSTVIPSYLVAEGIKRIGSDNAAIVGSVGPVSTILQAYIFLQEPVFALQIAGTILVLIGVLLIGKKK
ncbi:DMT family transporter [Chryseosolibacter indicus]|uniref:DMT family transporter n=1 Tax=Chryseosolibacter indicus TaxID=2782351 RepID=A0ABS5VPV7_9BACT|nr:DMT family transporter [Chryseosolibacter indicus]MBT1703058.1 DMT family transporter [Chryseosolibacter indicus]